MTQGRRDAGVFRQCDGAGMHGGPVQKCAVFTDFAGFVEIDPFYCSIDAVPAVEGQVSAVERENLAVSGGEMA